MAESDAQDRQLPASARKLKKAREEGQIARSRDLGHFSAMAVGLVLLGAAAPSAAETLQQMVAKALRFGAKDLARDDVMQHRMLEAFESWVWIALPAGAILFATGIGASLASGGWLWTLKPLAPKFDKFNPLSGIGRLFSKDQLIETLKACLLALVLGVVGWLYLRSHMATFSATLEAALPEAIRQVGSTLHGGLLLLVLVLAACAAIDVPLQRWRLGRRLRMSKEEAKQEYKEQEGSPEVRGRIKARMREMANRRMLQAVPQADLVVMNPTHYAVALKYEDGRMGAPRVVAKGADLMAMRIRDAAQGAKVPVLQAPVLARALYAHAELDREIPMALYSAVAQVLAYVYQLRASWEGRAPTPGDLPPLAVPPELDPHHAAPPPAGAEA